MPSVICPSCRHPIDFEPAQAGGSVKCPNCGAAALAVSEPMDHQLAAPPIASAAAPSQAPPVAGSTSPRVMVGWACPRCGTMNASTDVACVACRGPMAMEALGVGPPTDGMAIASLVLGLVACVPVIPQVLAVAFGTASLRRNRRRPGQVGGAGLAWAGLALGLFFGAIWALVLTGLIVQGSWFFSTTTTPGVAFGPSGALTGPADRDEMFPDVDEAMERLGKAMRTYMQDFKRMPAKLADLTPSYARRDELVYTDGGQEDRPFTYVAGLDPARDDPNTIAVYTAPLVPPPPEYFGYGGPYTQPDKPHLWKKNRAPRGTKRMVLRLNWQRELLSLKDFDELMALQRRGRPGARTKGSPATSPSKH